MTTEEIYNIAQEGLSESVVIGWFKENVPSNENWHEELCYYMGHDETAIYVYYCVKSGGKIHTVKETIFPSWIRKINHELIEDNKPQFNPDWGGRLLALFDSIGYWKRYCSSNFSHKFSSSFNVHWRSILSAMMDEKNVERARCLLPRIHKKSFDKIIEDLREVFFVAYHFNNEYYKLGKEEKYRKDKEMFGYLHNIFT